MPQIPVVIKLSLSEEEALSELIQTLGDSDESLFESRALDGGTLLTTVVTVGIPSISLLRTWMLARVAQRRGCIVQVDGDTYQGYSAEEVAVIVEALERAEKSLRDSPSNSESGADVFQAGN